MTYSERIARLIMRLKVTKLYGYSRRQWCHEKTTSFICSLTVDINNESNKLLCFIPSPSAIQRYCKGEKTKNNNKINGELKSLKQ